MRKRTNNSAIAKKSKSLIKKWQAVVEHAMTASSVVSGTQSNPALPSSHVSNHRRKEEIESAANSHCDSPLSTTMANAQPTIVNSSSQVKPLSLKIRLGKPPPDTNESSMSPAPPTIRNGPSAPIVATSQPEKRRIKTTAEIAQELEMKSQLNLSNETKEKLEKQRVEMPLQTINEFIPAPVLSAPFSHERVKRGKKRGPVECDNSPSPKAMLVSIPPKEGVIEGEEADGNNRLLSAEKSEMVKRFLDTSVPPSEMPLTPASAQQSLSPEPTTDHEPSSSGPSDQKFVFPDGNYIGKLFCSV